MSNQIIALTALLIALASSLGNAASAADTAPADKPADNSAPTSGIQPAWIDNSVRPQDDLFTHANGSWLKTTQIPADRSWYGEAGEMGDRSLEQQHQILEAAKTATDAQERKVGDLYASFMNTAVIEDRGIAPLQPTLDAVAAVRGRAQLSALMGDFYRNALPSPIGDQRFYLGFAQSWLGKEREAALIAQLKSDPHSPEKYRVNGVVVHMPSFYDAFGVTAKDKMWLAPSDRVTLW